MGAEILDCQIQDGLFVIWALASKEYYEKDLMENRTLVILHTDEHTPHCLTNHVSTIQSHGIVYHIFEVGSCH